MKHWDIDDFIAECEKLCKNQYTYDYSNMPEGVCNGHSIRAYKGAWHSIVIDGSICNMATIDERYPEGNCSYQAGDRCMNALEYVRYTLEQPVKEKINPEVQEAINNLIMSFKGSYLLTNRDPIEFLADKQSNTYFIIGNCETKLDVDCKVLEWLSRAACKTEPFCSFKKNNDFHKKMLSGINEYLGTSFTEGDMMIIYQHLGNAVNHQKTVEFVESGFRLSVIDERLSKYEDETYIDR